MPYRYAIFNKKKIKKRLGFGGSYKYKLHNVGFKYRTKYQKTYEHQNLPEELIRNKLSIVYKVKKKIHPYVSGELFHSLITSEYDFGEYRLSIGIALDLPQKNEAKIFYTYKKDDLNKKNPDRINIIGLAFNHKW